MHVSPSERGLESLECVFPFLFGIRYYTLELLRVNSQSMCEPVLSLFEYLTYILTFQHYVHVIEIEELLQTESRLIYESFNRLAFHNELSTFR